MRAFCTGAEPLNSSPGFFPEDEKVANKGSERFKQVWNIIFFVFGIRLKKGETSSRVERRKRGEMIEVDNPPPLTSRVSSWKAPQAFGDALVLL